MDRESAKQRHQKLLSDGWIRRFTAEEPRLSEMKEFYESLGLEVKLESGMLGDDVDCISCFNAEGFSDRYKTIYTSGREKSSSTDEDLFS
jgi:hypothetical protein